MIAAVKASELNEIGLAYDFIELKRHLQKVLNRFDHTCLNDIPPFDSINPSSENIAAVIHKELALCLSGSSVTLAFIEVWESPESRVVYIPGDKESFIH